jgi:hypothetical protein
MLLDICAPDHGLSKRFFKFDVNHPFGLVCVEDIDVAIAILQDIVAKIQKDGKQQFSSGEDDTDSSLLNLSSRFYEFMPTFTGMFAPVIIRDLEKVDFLNHILIEDRRLSENHRIDHHFQSRAIVCAIEREETHSLPSSKPNPMDLSFHRRLYSSLDCHIHRLEPGPELKMLHDMIVTPFPFESLFAAMLLITHDHLDRRQQVFFQQKTECDERRGRVLCLPRRRGC